MNRIVALMRMRQTQRVGHHKLLTKQQRPKSHKAYFHLRLAYLHRHCERPAVMCKVLLQYKVLLIHPSVGRLLGPVRFLSMFGMADVRETVDRLMKETMSNELARMYNMKWLKGKKKFVGL
ncbi:uncharacterized protein LOC132749966 [Ruditapes philippinarum]|uniref:uncharacterized protein LOC132749966 n=1 Tax=Ruditapes philippinarum TaxID=129788 RepID=UPI00295B943B|nr:uncharacterized protein LOC132749966 [Ruditapes philippinarum]